MSKHFGNMKRLQSKLIARYGAEDDLVKQVSEELEVLEAIESKRSGSFIPRASLRRKADLAMPPPISK
ncbi:MAG: hypothetical protein WCG50_09995 [Rhodoferax sp.]|uniref:hypothetical protein n=1 Tax=Rhodoferax sp. TaxID=50421 RepID=UPI0030197A59